MKRLQSVHARTERGTDVDQASQEFRYGWIGPRAAMQHLGIGSPSALHRLIVGWQLPYGRLGRLYRFRRADLDQWLLRRSSALREVR